MTPKRFASYRIALGLALAAIALSITGSSLFAQAQPGAIAAPAQIASTKSPEPFASVKKVEPFTYCCIAHKGPLTDVGTVIGQFMQAMQAQGLFAGIRGPMVGVYYNSPGEVKPEELSWEVGFTMAPEAAPKAPIEKKEWKYLTVAAAVHAGPYANIGETYQRLGEWIKSRGYKVCGPTLDRYLNNPMQVKPEELRTEIWIPVEK
ncbi:MAG: GyrI-like domain-containing protein [Acidobacteriota bacterium]